MRHLAIFTIFIFIEGLSYNILLIILVTHGTRLEIVLLRFQSWESVIRRQTYHSREVPHLLLDFQLSIFEKYFTIIFFRISARKEH